MCFRVAQFSEKAQGERLRYCNFCSHSVRSSLSFLRITLIIQVLVKVSLHSDSSYRSILDVYSVYWLVLFRREVPLLVIVYRYYSSVVFLQVHFIDKNTALLCSSDKFPFSWMCSKSWKSHGELDVAATTLVPTTETVVFGTEFFASSFRILNICNLDHRKK